MPPRRRALGLLLALACTSEGSLPDAAPTPGSDAAPPMAAGTVVLRNIALDPLPLWVAWSDGDGPWQRLGGDGLFTIRPSTERYGLAVRCLREGSLDFVSVTQALVSEVPRVEVDCGRIVRALLRVSVDASAVPGTARVGVSVGYPRRSYQAGSSSSQTVELTVPQGTAQIGVMALGSVDEPLAAALRRDVEITGDTRIDFDLGTGTVPLVHQPLSITGAGPAPQVAVWMGNAGGSQLYLAGTPGEYVAVAPAGLMPGDVQSLNVADYEDVPGGVRSVIAFIGRTPPGQVTLPPPLAVAVQRLSVSSYDLFRFSFDPQPAARYYLVEAGYVRSKLTAGWLGSRREYTQPDLGAVPGWQASWAPMPGTAATAGLSAHGSNRSFAESWNPALIDAQAEGVLFTITGREINLPPL